MASRPIVQQQNRRAPGNAKITAAAADGKNRRALGDIGNVDPKKISRPVTRRFSDKLVANAQAQAYNKKVAKPKRPPIETEIIAPEVEKPEKEAALSKKEAKSFASILCDRSKAVCESLIDIDAGDVENELAVVEYIDDMYKFYKLDEKENRVQDYIELQPEISKRMRTALVDWIIDAHQKFELRMETLYLTINIVDRFLSLQVITQKEEFRLVGMGAMLMASKYEEDICAPKVNDFVSIVGNAYTHKQVLATEKRILERLEWNISVATPYVFLVRFIKASVSDADVENMAHFLAEIGMANYEAAVMFAPSLLVAAAVYAARCALLKKKRVPIWNKTLKVHTGYMESDLMECAKLLVDSHSTIRENKQLKGIYTKYSSLKRGAVALRPPAVLQNQPLVGKK